MKGPDNGQVVGALDLPYTSHHTLQRATESRRPGYTTDLDQIGVSMSQQQVRKASDLMQMRMTAG